MPTIKDMLASLKRAHTFKTDGWTCPAHPDANGGACLCGIDAFNARIDAVAAQVADELANRDALIDALTARAKTRSK